jgi:hypothetical protein
LVLASSITKPAKMVGVLGLATLGLVAFVTLRTARNFLRNLEGAKKTGLPYVIGRKLDVICLTLCAARAGGTARRFGDLEIFIA